MPNYNNDDMLLAWTIDSDISEPVTFKNLSHYVNFNL
jgi:hypothetical protein